MMLEGKLTVSPMLEGIKGPQVADLGSDFSLQEQVILALGHEKKRPSGRPRRTATNSSHRKHKVRRKPAVTVSVWACMLEGLREEIMVIFLGHQWAPISTSSSPCFI